MKCSVYVSLCSLLLVWQIILLPTSVGAIIDDSAESGNSEACGNPRRTILRDIVEGDLDAAYNLSVVCEKFLETHLDKVNLSVLYLRSQYLVTAQILALQGNLEQSELKRLAAEKLDRSDLALWESYEDGAMGLLLEKSKDKEKALNWYSNHSYSETNARRALIYLEQSRDHEAMIMARSVLSEEPDNPTATIVLAALSEKTDPARAREYYEKALKRLRQVSTTGTNFSGSPIYYAEGPRAKAAIERLRISHP